MRQLAENYKFYKQVNTERVKALLNAYEALCETAYDPKGVHKCWVEFTKELGYNTNTSILEVKEKVDNKMEWIIEYIDEVLDKMQNG
ncbi:MAG: hypothetical protein M1365_12600 [Actinobacteria bacterium]|nr:hypothetical protein [Actinomycetota bacterium]